MSGISNDTELSSSIGLDVTNFKKGVTQLNNQINAIENNFKSSAVIMGDWSKKSNGLSNRVKSLTDELKLQKDKLRILTTEYNKAISSENADEKAVKSLVDQMYKCSNQIQKTEKSIKKYSGQLDDMTSDQKKAEKGIKSMSDQAEKSQKKIKKLGNGLKDLGSKAGKVGRTTSTYITTPIVAAGVASFKTASDVTESMNKVGEVFSTNSEEITKWSKNSIEKFGLARGTTLDMVSAYGDMATGMGFTSSEASELGKQLVARGADLSSFKNISVDVSNTALTSVFTGETESLKKLGVIMTQANLKQYMLQQGYTKTYEQLTQKEQVMLRVNYVLHATNKAEGDFARTSGESAGQVRIFKESLKEVADTFGQEIVPMVNPIIQKLNDGMKHIGDLDSGTKKAIITFAGLAASLGPALLVFEKLATTAGGVVLAMPALKSGFANLSAKIAAVGTSSSAAAAGVTTLHGLLVSTAGIIGAVVVAIGGLIIGMKKVGDCYNEMQADKIDDFYDHKKEKRLKEVDGKIDSLEKERNALSSSLQKEMTSINDYYDKKASASKQSSENTKKRLEEINKAYQESHEKRLEEIQEEQKRRKEAIDRETENAVSGLQNRIDAIDEKTKKEDKALKYKENQDKIAELKEKIRNATNITERRQIQKELEQFLSQIERERILEERDLEKQALQEQINNLNKEATEKKKLVDKEIEDMKKKENVKYKALQENIQRRISAESGYTSSVTANMERARQNALNSLRKRTYDHQQEIDKQIEKERELREEIEKSTEEKRESAKQDSKLGFFASYKEGMKVIWNNLMSTSKRASGDNDWRGGLVNVHEGKGGEILNLPRHTQIIPHDVSVDMARSYGKNLANIQTPSSNTVINNYAPPTQTTIFQVEAEKVSTAISPTVAYTMSQAQANLKGALGYGN